MKKQDNKANPTEGTGASSADTARAVNIRNRAEATSTFGLLLVCVGLVGPFAGAGSSAWLIAFKWIFAAGAAIYTAARFTGAWPKGEPFRIRRLRRMECWAGIAFCVASFFWFWNTRAFDGVTLTFRMLNETIIFTLAGALIQIIASWMLAYAQRKQK
ncbi:MAG: hypothetical protein K2M87_03055 [Muribaculaceae bacterium]|nr:hypothetical protein [Muribaculaceae bacterium]